MDQTTELLSAWIDSARDYAIILVDPDGRVSSWNIGAERILGYAEGEAIGQSVALFFLPEDREHGVPQREIERALANGRASDDRWHMRKDGSRFWCSGVLMRVGNDLESPDGFVKVMRDLTERKLMEERLRARTEELIAADRRRNEFLAMLSHELRNPLAPIMTSVYLLRERAPDNDPVVREAREMIERQAQRMKHLLDGLLDIARLALNRIELHKVPMELGEVVARAVETSRPTLDELRHELTIAADPQPMPMLADPVRLEQTVAALLSNAARFSDPGGRISITVGRDAGHAVVRVRDSGVGMEPEMLERAFELFAQADQGLARTAGGLGIGLALARSLARLHGGTLEGLSEGRGHGSEFVLRLPIIAPDADTDHITTVGSSSQAKIAGDGPGTLGHVRILLVDDNRDAARSTELVLRQADHDVIVAYDGQSAIELALNHRPDLAILDVGLPQIDGYGVARELRRQSTIPLVALTGYAPDHSSSLLFDAYLIKPVQPDELVRVLTTLR
jgi:two-component system CheB/CheR fusion protein